MMAELTRMITKLIQALRCKPSALSAMKCCWQDPRTYPENMLALTLTCKNRAYMQAVLVAIKKIAQWAHTHNQYLCMHAWQRHMYSAVHAGCTRAERARVQGQADQRSTSSKLRSLPSIFMKTTNVSVVLWELSLNIHTYCLKRTHHYRFCSLRARQGLWKAAMVCK